MNKTKNFILFDDSTRENLLPLTFTRPVAELRVGITTLREKWENLLGLTCSCQTAEYLSKKYPVKLEPDNIFINSSVIANANLAEAIVALNDSEILITGTTWIAYRHAEPRQVEHPDQRSLFKEVTFKGNVLQIKYPWDIFVLNDQVMREDFKFLTSGRKSQPLSKTNTVLGAGELFVEEGIVCECAVINATSGPVYIGRQAEIMEGAVIRGPFAMCKHSTVKMGAKIYGATTIGPHCKVGGEVHNSVFIGFASKAHDGFLGNAVIGEWCNLGADTNNSNLKNNYAEVKLWNYPSERFINTGLQFCGLIMGDHSKCGINTMFNTGTVVGVSANIFGAGFPRNFIPSFSWGGAGGFMVYTPEKALETAEIAMKRRNIELLAYDREIFQHIFKMTEKFRNY